MKILLVYPQYPDTFWSFKHALKLGPRKALNTPLGPLTVAAMLPGDWEKKFVDMNVNKLTDKDIRWADYVFISAMVVQQRSAQEVVKRCKSFNTRVVAGGPFYTTGYGLFDFSEIDHIILNEAEVTLPLFLADLEKGCPQHVYRSDEKADVHKTPIPLFSLVNLKKYAQVTIQYCRGCPFDCEFCDIVVMDGHKPRTKTRAQIIGELEAIYAQGYRGTIFIVDDNFIGNRKKLKSEIMPVIIEWQKAKGYPFRFLTEASVNLADDEELMQLMSDSGFTRVFVGIESPNEESLTECHKFTNKNRDLIASVKRLQNYGFEVMGGFIVGFDSDPVSIFKSQINFIQNSGIVTAMVGLLNAPPKTKLWHRLIKENRVLPGGNGDNTDGTTNFIPKMRYDVLVNGYKQILHTIYSPKQYYDRIQTFFQEYQPNGNLGSRSRLKVHHIVSMIKSALVLGVKDGARMHYWRLMFTTLLKYPRLLGLSITLAAQGFHFRKVYEKVSKIQIDDTMLARQLEVLDGGSL
ncbi:MAG: B12-binding domain-containing radical SAM protein [Dehalococcoidales bacterium]|nr:B12-binding domain-containing radical SAM protein [Dehalococcoidales bacterium]